MSLPYCEPRGEAESDPAARTWLLEHQDVLRRGVHGQRAGPLHGAVRAAGHAVAAARVGEPEVLGETRKGVISCILAGTSCELTWGLSELERGFCLSPLVWSSWVQGDPSLLVPHKNLKLTLCVSPITEPPAGIWDSEAN